MSAERDEQLVRDFLAGWGVDLETSFRTIDTYFTDDCLWENIGLPPCRGKEEAAKSLQAYHELTGFERLEVRIRHVLAKDGLVVTERTDHNLTGCGEPIGTESEPVLGIFEIRDGKIAAWRDYFDPRGFLGLWGSADASPTG